MIRCLLLVSLLIHSTLAQRPVNKPVPNPVQKAPSKTWLTLNGDRPLVIARGGFSGLFPESSQFANKLGMATSLPDMVLYCNLQLSKDGYGICQSELRLDNSTNISLIYPKGQKTHIVNGQDLQGWFAMDFTTDELFKNVTLTQSIFSRPSLFDGQMPLSAVEDAQGMKPSKFWLNVPYDELYIQNKIIPATFVQKAMMGGIHFISSPEIGFLKVMNGRINKARTKLILKFPEVDGVEPTTKQKYSSILKDFNAIKAYASGILVPKGYIWPVNKDLYLQPPTTLVTDAHKQSLEVYAYGFANDMPASYNYSYDPRNEYLQFVDNSKFAVDGVLTDFPPTASEAIACFTQNKNETKLKKGKALIISKDGASGVYAGSTDLAYQQAIEDGADIIDCSVQMSKDGVAFCLSTADLMGSTTAVTTFMTRSATIPEIQNGSGIFSFDLTWSEIQTLKPQLANPIPNSDLKRNPAYKNAGKFVTLQEFLELAKAKAVTGVLINIENAAYLASKKGLSITDAVSTALSNATFDKQATQQVLIQSDDTSVLSIFKNVPAYKRVLSVKEVISDVPKETVDEIKKYADAVSVPKGSLVVISGYFTSSFTKVVEKLHAANISVYVSVLRNEFVTLPFDFFSDPVVALHTYIEGLGVNGVVTDYPATAKAYTVSPCSDLKGNVPYNIPLSEAGSLLGLAPPDALPPAEGPAPALNAASVVDPPLPPVTNVSPPGPSDQSSSPAPSGTPPSSGLANTANTGLSLVVIIVLSLLSMGY